MGVSMGSEVQTARALMHKQVTDTECSPQAKAQGQDFTQALRWLNLVQRGEHQRELR